MSGCTVFKHKPSGQGAGATKETETARRARRAPIAGDASDTGGAGGGWAIPNIISAARIVGALALLLFDYPSAAFLAVFALCGASDAVDGWLARRLDANSAFGAKLDTAADLVLVAVCCAKILPVLAVPAWIWAWVACIAVAKGAAFAAAWRRGRTEQLHSLANRAMGIALFASVFLVPLVGAFWVASTSGLAAVLATLCTTDALHPAVILGAAVILCAAGTIATIDDVRRVGAHK